VVATTSTTVTDNQMTELVHDGLAARNLAPAGLGDHTVVQVVVELGELGPYLALVPAVDSLAHAAAVGVEPEETAPRQRRGQCR
jgi:hypothetical protein